MDRGWEAWLTLAMGDKRPPSRMTGSSVSGISWSRKWIHQPSLKATKKWSAALSRHRVAFSPSGKKMSKKKILKKITHWHYLGTGQKRVEFRSTWLLGSSFLWNIWPEWLSVVKYWPHQKSTNYFFQLRWKLTWNIRIGFKTKLLISARCVLSVWSYNEGLKIYMKIGKKNGKWLVKGIKPFK